MATFFIHFVYFVYLLSYLREECVDFIHICYSNQIPCVADACLIAFGSMPNVSNYSNSVLRFYVFGAISKK